MFFRCLNVLLHPFTRHGNSVTSSVSELSQGDSGDSDGTGDSGRIGDSGGVVRSIEFDCCCWSIWVILSSFCFLAGIGDEAVIVRFLYIDCEVQMGCIVFLHDSSLFFWVDCSSTSFGFDIGCDGAVAKESMGDSVAGERTDTCSSATNGFAATWIHILLIYLIRMKIQ